MKNRVILQIRSDSKRLPKKSLKKIKGLPLGLVCAKRLTNVDNDFVVATSNKKTDNTLSKIFEKNKFKVFRGNLDDVLSRYHDATLDLKNNDTVTRVTGDNIFPDGKFAQEALRIFKKKKLDYLFCKSPKNGLPYGLSIEIFKVKQLRSAYKNSKSKFDREHVTPWIFRNTRNKDNLTNHDLNLLDLRTLNLSIDTKIDFKRVYKFIKKTNISSKDLTKTSWYELLNKYYYVNYKYKKNLIIGSANFDNRYGYHNSILKKKEIKKIFILAKKYRIKRFDTAQSYGSSEKFFKRKKFIIDTKFALTNLKKKKLVAQHVCKKLYNSLKNLGQNINTIIFHDWNQYIKYKNEIYKIIKKKFKNKYNKFGISIYHPFHLKRILKDKNIHYIQFPLNILDQRFIKKKYIKLLKKNNKIEISIRSIFLQGIMFKKIHYWPSIKKKKIINKKINRLVKLFSFKDKLELCFLFAKSFDWVDSIVFGIDNSKQFKEIYKKYIDNLIFKFSKKNLKLINKEFNDLSKKEILPYMWKKNV